MRKVKCEYCDGEVLSEQNGRTSSSVAAAPRSQNIITAISDAISTVLGGPKTVPRKEALGGKCDTCGNTQKIEDVTDTSKQDKEAANYLESKADRILELETKLGMSPGGNFVRRTAGAKIEIIGRTLNTAKSYTVHEGKAAYRAGGKVTAKGRGGLPVGPEKGKGGNVITGNNPPANTGGGLYYIQCGNKFKLVAGAQGIEISTNGPITFDGGITRLTGAEVTVGSGKGPVLVQGDNLNLVANNAVNLDSQGPNGSVNIGGSMSITGNIQSGAGLITNLYFENATCPEKQETSKIGSQTDLITGPAQWTPTLKATATKNLVKWAQDSAADITLAGAMNPLNPRSMLKMKDNMINAIYSGLPVEPIPTGLIMPGTPMVLTGTFPGGTGTASVVVTTPIPLQNFPHTHSMPDEAHSHNYSVPAINYKGHTAESVRAEADAAGINTRVPAAASGGAGDYLTKIVGGVTGAFKAVTGLFASDGYKISGAG
jgi:hypothetical protein